MIIEMIVQEAVAAHAQPKHAIAISRDTAPIDTVRSNQHTNKSHTSLDATIMN